jgi:hypothetical protein
MYFSPMAQQSIVGQNSLTIEASRSHSDTPQFGGVISSTPKPLPNKTKHSKETGNHDLGGIVTRNPSKRASADPRLRLCGLWDRLSLVQIFATSHRLLVNVS